MDTVERIFPIFLFVILFAALSYYVWKDTIRYIELVIDIQNVEKSINNNKQLIKSLEKEIKQTKIEIALVTDLSDEARKKLAIEQVAGDVVKNKDELNNFTHLLQSVNEKAKYIDELKDIEASNKRNIDSLSIRFDSIEGVNTTYFGIIAGLCFTVILAVLCLCIQLFRTREPSSLQK